jgi:hypothetical protein
VTTISLSATSPGTVWLSLVQDGATLASTTESTNGAASLTYSLVLPENSVGSTVTLQAIAQDGAGRTTTASQTYVVLPDGDPPAISFPYASQPPTQAVEGGTTYVYAHAIDTDADLRSIAVYVDGVQVGIQSYPYNNSSLGYQPVVRLPNLSDRPVSHITAVATDSRGRTATVARDVTLVADRLPTAYLSAPASAAEGSQAYVQGWGSDPDNAVVSVVVYADDVEIGRAIYSSVGLWYRLPARATKTSIRFRAVVTDDSGRTAEAATVTTLTGNQAPTVSITSTYSPVIAGYAEHFCANGYDDAQVASIELDLDSARFTSPLVTVSSGTSDSKQVCADYVVPQEASVAAAAVVKDSFGHGATTSWRASRRISARPSTTNGLLSSGSTSARMGRRSCITRATIGAATGLGTRLPLPARSISSRAHRTASAWSGRPSRTFRCYRRVAAFRARRPSRSRRPERCGS